MARRTSARKCAMDISLNSPLAPDCGVLFAARSTWARITRQVERHDGLCKFWVNQLWRCEFGYSARLMQVDGGVPVSASGMPSIRTGTRPAGTQSELALLSGRGHTLDVRQDVLSGMASLYGAVLRSWSG